VTDPTPEETYRVTFGIKYRREPHPMGGDPDGWVEIYADDEATARLWAHMFLHPWAFMYDHLDAERGRWNPELHPKGALRKVDLRKDRHD